MNITWYEIMAQLGLSLSLSLFRFHYLSLHSEHIEEQQYRGRKEKKQLGNKHMTFVCLFKFSCLQLN